MGADINTVKTQVFEIIKKNQSSGYIKTVDFNNYAKLEQLSFYNSAFKASEGTQQSMDVVDELKVTVNLFPDTDGLIVKPTDYMQYQSMTGRIYVSQSNSKLVQFHVMGQSEADAAEFSDFSKPSRKFPIAIMNADTIQVEPKTAFSSVRFNYYKMPTPPVWGFTTASNREVYSEGSSTNFNVPEQHIDSLVKGIVNRFGFSVGNEALVNYK